MLMCRGRGDFRRRAAATTMPAATTTMPMIAAVMTAPSWLHRHGVQGNGWSGIHSGDVGGGQRGQHLVAGVLERSDALRLMGDGGLEQIANEAGIPESSIARL